jgi:hypothetical protein
MAEKLYQCIVTETGSVAGGEHQEGEILTLTERQKRTGIRRERIEVQGELGPLGELVDLEPPAPKKVPAKKIAKRSKK